MPRRPGRFEGLYLVTSPVRPIPRLASIVAAAIDGGASLVQFREKDPAPADRLEAGRAVASVCRPRGVPFLVNDDADLARRLDADGVHIGRGDTPTEAARSMLGPTAIVGVTLYGDGDEGEEEAARRAGADYLAVGPFFPSPTKPQEAVIPLTVLDGVVRRARLPVFAIGGITAERARLLARHGIAGVAVVSAIMGAPNPRDAAVKILDAFESGAAHPRPD